MSLERKVSGMRRWARFIDRTDMVIGPTTVLAYHVQSDIFYKAFSILSAVELFALKIPFMVTYVAKTRDFKSLGAWALKEAVVYSSPTAPLLDVIPSYSALVAYRNKV